jgi:glyoxylase-like metal-dependent hydrolase (beta-lactamase superfamily II)
VDISQIKDPTFEVNIYLLADEPATLVDAGTGLAVPAILAAASRYADPRSIRQIILTHRHIDHVGGAQEISLQTGAVIRASEDDAKPLVAGDDDTVGGSWLGRRLSPMDVEPLAYGDRIEAGGGVWRVVHTPGHTVGSITLHDEESGSLLSGDTVFTNGGVGRWDLPTGSYTDLVASIRFLESLSPENLYPGHGPYSEGDALEHIQMALQFIDMVGAQEVYR